MLSASRITGLWLCCILGLFPASTVSAAGPYPAEVTGWTPQIKERQRQAARALVVRLAEALKSGAHRLVVEPGEYRFGGTASAVLLRGVSDFTIEATGATFWIEPSQKAVELDHCRRVTVHGLSIDYDPLPFVQARVLKLNPNRRSIEVEVAEGYPLPIDAFVKRPGAVKALFFDPTGTRMRNPAMDWLATSKRTAGRVFELTFINGRVFAPGVNVTPGDWLALPNRDQSHTIVCGDSGDVIFDRITVYASASFAFVEHGGPGRNFYRDCRLVPRPGTNRTLACNADGFHSLAVAQGPTLEGCELSYAGDDFVNIHGYFDLVIGQGADGRALVLHQFDTPLIAGAEFAAYSLESVGATGGGTVADVRLIEQGPTAFQTSERLREQMKARGIVLRDFVHPEVLSVRFSTPAPFKPGTLITLPGYCGAHAVIRNCFLHDNIARGLLIGGDGTVVQNNRIERTGTAGIVIGSERYWLEARPASHLLVAENQLIDDGVSLSSVGESAAFPAALCVFAGGPDFKPQPGKVAFDLNLNGNRILRSAAAGIFVFGLEGGQISNNQVESPQSAGSARTGAALGLGELDFAIVLAGSHHVAVDRNRVTALASFTRGAFRDQDYPRKLSSP